MDSPTPLTSTYQSHLKLFQDPGFKPTHRLCMPSFGFKSPAVSRSAAKGTKGSKRGDTAKKDVEPAEETPTKKKDAGAEEVAVLKDRLAKGHRLNDGELAQLELAAVARWNQLQREDDEEFERQREAEAEKERQREQKLAAELRELRNAAAADRANLERAGAAVADELRELRELKAEAARDRDNLEEAVAQELAELRELRDAQKVAQRRAAAPDPELLALQAIYDTSDEPAEPPPPPPPVGGFGRRASRDGAGAAATASAAATAAAAASAAEAEAYVSPRGSYCCSAGPSCAESSSSGPPPEAPRGGPPSKAAVPHRPPPPRKTKPKLAPTPTPVDPEDRERNAAFEEYANERRRIADASGEAPPPYGLLADGWESLPNGVRARYERTAAAKAKALAVEREKREGSSFAEVEYPQPGAPSAPRMNRDAMAAKARVDFGRGRPAEPAPRRRKLAAPPRPLGSACADLLSVLALLLLGWLLSTHYYACESDQGPVHSMVHFASRRSEVDGHGGRALAYRSAHAGLPPPSPSSLGDGGGFADFDAAASLAALGVGASAFWARLNDDVVSSCTEPFATEAGTLLMHMMASLVGSIALCVQLAQLWARAQGRAITEGVATASMAASSSSSLLPTTAPTSPGQPAGESGGGSSAAAESGEWTQLAPWTSLAAAELFVASYAAKWFAEPISAHGGAVTGSAAGSPWEWDALRQMLLGAPSAAHAAALTSCAMLLVAASWRALQIFIWHRRAAAAAAGAPIATKPAKPAAKSAPVAPAGGKAGGRARGASKGQTGEPPKRRLFSSWCCLPCLDAGAPAPAPAQVKGGRGVTSTPARRSSVGRKAMV